MSQEQVERLESLLARVQENRKRTRTPAGLGAPGPHFARAPAVDSRKPAPEPARAAPVAQPAPVARPAAPHPTAAPVRSAPPPPAPQKPAVAAPARPAPAAPPMARAPVPEAPARRPGQDRGATPLEMAVAELDLAKPAASKVDTARREALYAPTAPVAPPDIAFEESLEPHVIEPEPIREAGRPIAQVVSRHSPQVDATFGAMLKRSLTLRPH